MEYEIGDRVQLTIQRATDLGYVVMIDDEFEGLLFRNEVFQPLTRYAEVRGYIKNIREDGKIDVSLRPQGFRNVINSDVEKQKSELENKYGSITINLEDGSFEEVKQEEASAE